MLHFSAFQNRLLPLSLSKEVNCPSTNSSRKASYFKDFHQDKEFKFLLKIAIVISKVQSNIRFPLPHSLSLVRPYDNKIIKHYQMLESRNCEWLTKLKRNLLSHTHSHINNSILIYLLIIIQISIVFEFDYKFH